MNRKRYVFRKNFLILLSFILSLIVVITFFIYQNAVTVIEKEIASVNMNQAIQAESNLSRAIRQADRLASSLCVDESVQLFWRQTSPEKANEEFYNTLYAKLKAYVYSLNDYVSSIMLYSPEWNRVMDQDMRTPYVLKGRESDQVENIGWIEGLEDIDKLVNTKIIYRKDSNNYPYVMTIVKQYQTSTGWGAVAVDIDLKKVYKVVWPEAEGSYIWIADGDCQVIIHKDKNELFAEIPSFEELSLFKNTVDEVSVIWDAREMPIAYAQRYCKEYDLYVMAVTELRYFHAQMQQVRLRTVVVGVGCIIAACFLVWLYVSFVNKPLKSILSLLQHPSDYHEYMEQSEHEVQEIVDYIVSNLQTNNALQSELEKRLDLLHHTQLQALKAQINPHFLFNTLNVIVMLIDAEVEDSTAAQVTANLADVLHYSLSDDDLVALADELEYTRKYVYILEQRYKGRFRTEFDIAPELLDIKVPKLTLQPLIENAVFHGIAPKDISAGGLLRISGSKQIAETDGEERWTVCLKVQDNGKGMSQEDIERVSALLAEENITMSHIGIQNVAKRLALLFPQRSKMEIKSEKEKGTCVSLFFPYARL